MSCAMAGKGDPMDTGELFTFEEVRHKLRCGRRTISRMVDDGRLEVISLGPNLKRITERSLQKLIDDSRKKEST